MTPTESTPPEPFTCRPTEKESLVELVSNLLSIYISLIVVFLEMFSCSLF